MYCPNSRPRKFSVRFSFVAAATLTCLFGNVVFVALAPQVSQAIAQPSQPAALDDVQAAIQRGAINEAVQAAASIDDDAQRYQAMQRIADSTSKQSTTATAGDAGEAAGGAALADFDTLIELLTTTVSPEDWEEVGGSGTVAGFPTGVLLDARDRKLVKNQTLERPLVLGKGLGKDVAAKNISHAKLFDANAANLSDVVAETAIGMRSVSLPRLESALLARFAQGRPPTEEMLSLGGLERIEYVAVYPEEGDVVLVGPVAAGAKSGERGLHLCDLATVLHNALQGPGKVTCSITPDQANLARTQAYLTETGKRPLKPGQRKQWLAGLREALGKQDVQFEDIEPDAHMALTMLAADYHMKLIGMGIKPGGPVESYLETVRLNEDGSPPEMAVLRWWFTLLPTAIETNTDKDVFRLPRQLLQVQSENEMLADQGKRVHTGESEPLNREYAARFTRHFPALAAHYPIYAQLHRSAELMVVGSLLRDQRLCERVDWQPTFLVSQDPYLVPPVVVPRQVDTVVNHRVLNEKTIIAGISGGVELQPRTRGDQIVVRDDYALEQYQRVAAPSESRKAARQSAGAGTLRWWWD